MDKLILRKEYENLLHRYNKKVSDNHWSYKGTVTTQNLPDSGFKIHLSATILNANQIIELCIPYLINCNAIFKIVSKLNLFELQNRGLYGFSQVGKLITIYPTNKEELNILLEELNMLTKGINSPIIPSDFNYKQSSVVYYRFGAFTNIVNKENGASAYFAKLPNGKLFEDTRQRKVPPEINIPIKDYFNKRLDKIPENYIILNLLRKRGKGGVYKIFDLENKELRILKEGTYLGEMEPSGMDGLDRIIWENEVLESMKQLSSTPLVYDSFYIGTSYFLVQEFFEGNTLEEISKVKTFDTEEALNIIIKVSEEVQNIHEEYGYILRDLSFNNIILTNNNDIKLIDFEFAHKIYGYSLPYTKVGSIGFYDGAADILNEKIDIYSLASILYYLLHSEDYKVLSEMNNTFEKDYIEEITYKELININEEYRNIISKGLNYKYESIRELLCDLYHLKG